MSPVGSVFGLKAKANERTKKGLASLGLDNAIRLRWALRDIKGKRLLQFVYGLSLTEASANRCRTVTHPPQTARSASDADDGVGAVIYGFEMSV
jgi:hypothetical protein